MSGRKEPHRRAGKADAAADAGPTAGRTPRGRAGLRELRRFEVSRRVEVVRRFELTGLLIGLGIFLFALGVRGVYLYQSSNCPTFNTPLVDARTYDKTARELAPHLFQTGDPLEQLGVVTRLGFFWQPFFYPYALAVLYRIGEGAFGQDPLVFAKIVQIIIGALTCAMVYMLGRRIFDRPTGIIAGLITALCGPLIYYEADLVAAGWAAFWSVALLLLALRTGRAGSIIAGALLGLAGGLAVLTRPTFLPLLVAIAVWLVVRFVRDKRSVLWSLPRLVPGLVLFVVAVTPVAVKAQRFDLIKKFTFLPVSGGINFYIGNNENMCETLNTRPGMSKWSQLAEPGGEPGDTNLIEHSQVLGRKLRAFITTHPVRFVGGLVQKTLRFASSREMPRNEDVYVMRNWSSLLRALLWKAGLFGFPWGVIFPLAVVGVVWRGRQLPAPLLLYLLLYPAAIILVFVSARYRVETVPIFAVPAAASIWGVVQAARAKNWLAAAAPLAYAAGLAVLISLPGPFCEERVNYEAEMYVWLGDDKREQARVAGQIPNDATEAVVKAGQAEARRLNAEARELYEKAVALAPDSNIARVHLGYLLKSLSKYDEALEHLNAALEREPDFLALYYRADICSRKRDDEGALRDFNACIQAEPRFKQAYLARSALYQKLGRIEEAKADCRRVLELSPNKDEARLANIRLRQLE